MTTEEWTPAQTTRDWRRLRYSLESIRDLHDKDPDGGMGWQDKGGYGVIDPACRACGTSDEYAVPWPCSTRQHAEAALADLESLTAHHHALGCQCYPHIATVTDR